MEENGMGAPTLAERIKDSHPRKTEIPLSTLQRFLAGWGKNKSCVALCHRFVERVIISDPVAKLGERLSIFYGAGNGHDYSGDYVLENSRKDDPFGLKYPEPVMKITPDAGFWRVIERRYSDPDDTIYDGVLVCSGDVAVVVMKGRLMGLARNYTLLHEKYLLHARRKGELQRWELTKIGCGANLFSPGQKKIMAKISSLKGSLRKTAATRAAQLKNSRLLDPEAAKNLLLESAYQGNTKAMESLGRRCADRHLPQRDGHDSASSGGA
jgi:hypothetical protein